MAFAGKVARFIPFLDPSVEEWAWQARWLRWLTLVWLGLGLLVLFSASYPVAVAERGNGLHYTLVQLLWISLGLTGFNWLVRVPLSQMLRFSGLLMLVLLVLTGLTLVPGLGVEVNGATRWLPLGPFRLQPSELIKPCLVLQGARIFGGWRRLSWLTRLTWLGLFGAVLGVVLLQPNLSTAAICGLTLWLLALAAGFPYRHLLLTAGSGLTVAAISLGINPYQRDRITSFLNPWADPSGNGYQLIQSLLAIGAGGLWGQGYGLSQQKLAHLPIQYTDFIFAVYAEEFGLIGALALMGLLVAYGTLALGTALQAKQPLHRLVALGCMVLLVGQALLNIAVASGALPTTGLPFPLLSYGGSSMLSSLTTAALLVRTARESGRAEVVSLGTAKGATAPRD